MSIKAESRYFREIFLRVSARKISKKLRDRQCLGSLSRKQNCWDNALMERFFLNLKIERVWRQDYVNFEATGYNVTDYMINFHNSQRLHS
jgi:transposase InsO family protein